MLVQARHGCAVDQATGVDAVDGRNLQLVCGAEQAAQLIPAAVADVEAPLVASEGESLGLNQHAEALTAAAVDPPPQVVRAQGVGATPLLVLVEHHDLDVRPSLGDRDRGDLWFGPAVASSVPLVHEGLGGLSNGGEPDQGAWGGVVIADGGGGGHGKAPVSTRRTMGSR